MAIRYMSPTGWITIMLDLSRDFCWVEKDGTRQAVDRETMRASIANKRTYLGHSPVDSSDNLQPEEWVRTAHEHVEGSKGYYRFVAPTPAAIRREQARRAEANRKLKAAKAERGSLRRECAPINRSKPQRSNSARL